jgi:hypothetical protein
VIRLTNILKEIESDEKYKKMAYSWQKPDGHFIPIKYSHGSDAWQLLGKPDNTDGVVELWKKGWQRITYMVPVLYAHSEFQRPNDKQQAALIQLAMNLGLERVEWDGGDVGEKILWSIHDKLQENLRKQG